MTGAQAIAAIERWHGSETNPGLSPIRQLLRQLGDPQKKLHFIHVAGSNGKGSTCAMLSAVLRRAGYRTGLFTSPYIQDFRERIQIDEELISGEELAEITAQVLPLAEGIPGIRQFALITAIAMVYFHRRRCDIVVLEVGMGGIVDATNVIDCPEVAVITNIGLEHTEVLGHTVEEIAEKKAGIIKPGGHAVCYDGPPAVSAVVARHCAEVGAVLHHADNEKPVPLRQDFTGQTFSYRGKTYALSLLGPHQLYNAAVVLETVDTLRQLGWHIPEHCVTSGLAEVRWPARLEILCQDPLFILDGGHNPQCARALAQTLAGGVGEEKICCVMGVLDDKDVGAMIETMAPQTAQFYCTAPDSQRAMPAEKLADCIAKRNLPAVVCTNTAQAIERALASGRPVVAFGSLYLAGEIRTIFPALGKTFQRKQCLTRRRALSPGERLKKSDALCQRLLALPEVSNAKTIFSYAAAADEVNLSRLHQLLTEQGKTIAYPVVLPEHQMEVRLPDSEDAFLTGPYGIPSPAPQASRRIDPETIDLVLVPCVGFDRQMHRLGHGGGYYDRWLAQHPLIPRIAVAFEAQRLLSVLTDPHDLPMQKIVTEDNIYLPQKSSTG